MRQSGFSLAELLVVIAIIALLAAILLPASTLVREQSKAIKCASSLRQLGASAQAYALDNDGFMVCTKNPIGIVWFSYLQIYLEAGSAGEADADAMQTSIYGYPTKWTVIRGCPTYNEFLRAIPQPPWNIGYGLTRYPRCEGWTGILPNQVNWSHTDWIQQRYWPDANSPAIDVQLATITKSPQRILIGDSWCYTMYAWNSTMVNSLGIEANGRHKGKSNALFFDLRVAPLTANQFVMGMFQPELLAQ